MSNAITPITIDGEQYILRFPSLAQILIQKKAGEFLGTPNKRLLLPDILMLAVSGDVEAQAYLLWQGIMGGMPERRNMKFEEAVELRDKFLLGDDLDDGSRYVEFLETLGSAVDASYGADRKKSQEKMKRDREATRQEDLEVIYRAKAAVELKEPKNTTGKKHTEPA